MKFRFAWKMADRLVSLRGVWMLETVLATDMIHNVCQLCGVIPFMLCAQISECNE